MKKYIIIAIVMIALAGTIAVLATRLKKITEDRNIQRNNVETLLEDVQQYKTRDSLRAASVSSLQLTLAQYKRYRAEDAEIISTLKAKNKDLQDIITAQTENYYRHTVELQDSIIYLSRKNDTTRIPEVVKTANFSDKWHSLNIVISDSLEYSLKTKESILITNHVIPKRFLGFLWKCGIKEIKTDAVSLNPYTESMNVESINIIQ